LRIGIVLRVADLNRWANKMIQMKALLLVALSLMAPVCYAQRGGPVWDIETYSVRFWFSVLDHDSTVGPWFAEIATPDYYTPCLAAGIKDRVVFDFTVDSDGNVADVALVSAKVRELAEHAKKTVVKWKFRPARALDGKTAVARKLRCSIDFSCENDQPNQALQHNAGDAPSADNALPPRG
jgi:TonB family protein